MCSSDQSLVTVAFLWEKLSQSQFYKDSTRKTSFFEGWSWFKFNNLGLAVETNLKFCTSLVKGLKLKAWKFWGLIPTFVEVRGEKLVEGTFLHPPPTPMLNRVKETWKLEKKNYLKIKTKIENKNRRFSITQSHKPYIAKRVDYNPLGIEF